MPPEVIDLISSSPSEGRSPVARPVARSPTRIAKPSASSRIPTADELVDLADFDTTTEFDEPALPPPARPAAAQAGRRPYEPNRERSRIVLGSDPFASSDDAVDEDVPVLADVNGNKRRRVTPSESVVADKGKDTRRGRILVDDPISTSSPQPQPVTTKSPDPFASSPKEQSDDPFRSSPPPPARNVLTTRGHTAPEKPTKDPLKRSRQWNDPIFSSSAPDETARKADSTKQVIDLLDSDSDADSDGSLPDIANFSSRFRKKSPLRRVQSDVLPARRPGRPATKTKSAAERARDKEQKAAAKEAEQERKRQDKEAKLREKERNAALAEVNKIRTDKKVSTPEMIVDLPRSLNATVKTQVETLLEPLEVHYTAWDSPVENVIKWRRKVKSAFNEDMGHWEPIPQRVDNENHILVLNTAEAFVRLAQEDKLDEHIGAIRRHFPKHELVYLLEGMTPWMRKNRTIRNRQFTSGVRSNESTTTASRRRNARTQEYVEEDVVEDAMLQLQVVHDLLVHHTAVPLETAQWIAIFTQHISTIPYKKQRDQATLGAAFCMESGQVKTGDDARDSYTRLLQEIARVTAPIAYGVAAEYDSVSKLVNGLEREGPLALAELRKSANKDGVPSDRNIGQAVSRRLHKVFTGRDEASTDV